MRQPLALLSAALLSLAASPARADSIAGMCPDGSAFVVHERSQIPCARAKLVDPSELPPLRPEYLPRPYGWIVDQELRNPQNPYNLIEAAEKIRAARRSDQGEPSPATATSPPAAQTAPASAPSTPGASPAVRLALGERELRDLVELVALRQELAPAEFHVTDALGNEKLQIQLALSESLEGRVLDALKRDRSQWRVIVFSARALEPIEFHPNFFVVQDQSTFRPDPGDPAEVGLLLGAAGPQPEGGVWLGYFAMPARFDPARSLELWWNDRSVEVALEPGRS